MSPRQASRSKKATAAKSLPPALGADERALLTRLAERTGLSSREVLGRALAAYASAVAPELTQPATPAHAGKTLGSRAGRRGQAASKRSKLFYSVDGGQEREVVKDQILFGREPGCDVRLDLPLIADRHARVSFSEGRWLFEDLRSARGSFKDGQQIQVTFLASGDEIDLGGFLPLRFRLA